MKIPTGSSAQIEYPSSDGEPMSENQWQLDAMIDAINVLRTHFADCPGVYVSGDLLIYYEEGNPRARVAPDVFVVVGAPKHLRMNYKLWEEPGPPDFVLEVVASAGTRREAQGPKRALYARLGIREYWLFDPVGEYLAPPLQGFRLHDGAYHPLPARPVGGAPVLRSDALRLDLRVENERLRFHDPAKRGDLLTYEELADVLRDLRVRHAELELGHRPPCDEVPGAVLPGGLLPDHEELEAYVRRMKACNAELEGRAPPTARGAEPGRDMS